MHQTYYHTLFLVIRLVLALGAETKLDAVPGSMEFALPFSTYEDACVSFLLPAKNLINVYEHRFLWIKYCVLYNRVFFLHGWNFS